MAVSFFAIAVAAFFLLGAIAVAVVSVVLLAARREGAGEHVNLIPCAACGRLMSPSLPACPRCGAEKKPSAGPAS
jgi:hypothetical protein